jgi:hypothetical protein
VLVAVPESGALVKEGPQEGLSARPPGTGRATVVDGHLPARLKLCQSGVSEQAQHVGEVPALVIWQACLWGLLGAALVEGLELYQAIRAERGFPWAFRGQLKLAPYLIALILRLGLGTGLAVAFAASHQITGPLAAVTVGIAAPKILKGLARQGAQAKESPSIYGALAVPAAVSELAQARTEEAATDA